LHRIKMQYTNVNVSKRKKGTPVGFGVSGQHARTAPARVLTGLLVPAALAVAAAVLGWAASAPIAAVRAPGPAPVDALLALGAALLCAALLGLAAVGATLSLAVVLTGQVTGRLGRLALLLTPRVVRAAVGLAVGVTVIAGPALGASTASVATSVTATAAPRADVSPERPRQLPQLPSGWSPDRPAADDPAADDPAAEASTAPLARIEPGAHIFGGRAGTGRSDPADHRTVVVVHRGDTLWAIAARHLGPAATAAQVAAEWPRWHAANRSTIGADPDLILPGQSLVAPQRHPPADRATPDSTAADPASTNPATADRAPTASEESP
jgi:LysM domain